MIASGTEPPEDNERLRREPVDVAITEDVWGLPLEELARTRSVLRSPAAWQIAADLAAVASRARALPAARSRPSPSRVADATLAELSELAGQLGVPV
jgi:hypothetical protein